MLRTTFTDPQTFVIRDQMNVYRYHTIDSNIKP